MHKYADKRRRLGTQCQWEEGSGFISSVSLCSLRILLVSVWVFSRSSSFLPQSKRIHGRLTGGCVSECAACDGAETSPG